MLTTWATFIAIAVGLAMLGGLFPSRRAAVITGVVMIPGGMVLTAILHGSVPALLGVLVSLAGVVVIVAGLLRGRTDECV